MGVDHNLHDRYTPHLSPALNFSISNSETHPLGKSQNPGTGCVLQYSCTDWHGQRGHFWAKKALTRH
jgi:hypothetical protein